MGTYDKATGTIPTHWVYVKVTGLYVGNYRMMLSIGSAPTDSYNKVGEHKFYANSNIENPTEIAQRVFLGEETELKLGEEILEIDESNYGDYFGEAGQQYLGRLVLIKGVTCHYGEVDSNLYPSWMCTDLRPVESKYWYKWAVNENFYSNTSQKNLHCNFYGSVLFSYVGLPTQTMTKGVFVVRTSGYSRFAKQPVVRDGGKGDILAILGIYAKYWDQSYGAYQCSISHFDDLMFDESQFLTDAEAEALAPGRARIRGPRTSRPTTTRSSPCGRYIRIGCPARGGRFFFSPPCRFPSLSFSGPAPFRLPCPFSCRSSRRKCPNLAPKGL